MMGKKLGFLYKRMLKRKYWFTEQELELIQATSDNHKNIENRYLSLRAYTGMRPLLDEFNWHPIVHNKWISINYLRALGIKTPKTYGFLHPIYGTTINNIPLRNSKELFYWAKEQKLESFVIKHVGGGMGNNVFVVSGLKSINGTFVFETNSKEQITENVLNKLTARFQGGVQGFIIEEMLYLHEDIHEIVGDGLASLRIQTLRKKNGDCKVQFAFLRIGLPNKRTDHATNGGIMVPIDLTNGKLRNGLNVFDGYSWISKHPISHKVIEGKSIPDWKMVVDIVTDASKKSPGLPWVGWDVIPSNNGPRIIEGNVGNNIQLYQILSGGFLENGVFSDWEKEIGVKKPDGSFSWRLNHWSKGRRLKLSEQVLLKLQVFFLRNRDFHS